MRLRRKTVSQLYALSFYVIAYALVGIIWEFIETEGGTTLAGPVTGCLIGLALGALEMFGLTARTNRLPFMAAVFVKSVIFLIHLFVVFLRQLNILLGPGKLTWPARAGLHDANCIRIFVEILAEIHSKRDFYMDRYGQIPEFTIKNPLGDVHMRGKSKPMALVGLV